MWCNQYAFNRGLYNNHIIDMSGSLLNDKHWSNKVRGFRCEYHAVRYENSERGWCPISDFVGVLPDIFWVMRKHL